jgi:DNA-binding MarR family transcriptional regulator
MDYIVVFLKVVVTMNFSLSTLYGMKNYKITKSHTWLFLTMSLGCACILSALRLIKEVLYLHFDIYEKVIIAIELTKINLIPFVTAFLLAAAITVSRERISAVLPLEKPSEPASQYGIKQGTIYLVSEETSRRCYNIFLGLVSQNYRGLAILRTHPDEIRKKFVMEDVPILWMSRLQIGKNVVYPNVTAILHIIEEFLESKKNNVILLERLDYLISQQGFDTVLQFIQELASLMYITQGIALVQVDPLTLGERQLMLIEKETDRFKEIELKEELLEMLVLIYEKNRKGIKPNLKQIMKDLGVSRNTVRKRINSLRLKNLIVIKRKGRQKVLEVTPIGEDMLR